VPAQQRPRRHQQLDPLRPQQMDSRGSQQRPVSHPELRPRDLASQDRKLVPQHQQLNVLHVQASAATNKHTQQSPKTAR
jgi:hypothetical protein